MEPSSSNPPPPWTADQRARHAPSVRTCGLILLASGCLMAGPAAARASVNSPGPAGVPSVPAPRTSGSSLESAAAKAGNTGRAVAMSLIGLAFAG